jgi:putative flippase GtrA
VSTGLLLSPVAYHRLVFRRRKKESLVRAANVLAILGLVAVGLSITASVALVLSYVAPGVVAVVITIVVGALFTGLWFGLPLARREEPADGAPEG